MDFHRLVEDPTGFAGPAGFTHVLGGPVLSLYCQSEGLVHTHEAVAVVQVCTVARLFAAHYDFGGGPRGSALSDEVSRRGRRRHPRGVTERGEGVRVPENRGRLRAASGRANTATRS